MTSAEIGRQHRLGERALARAAASGRPLQIRHPVGPEAGRLSMTNPRPYRRLERPASGRQKGSKPPKSACASVRKSAPKALKTRMNRAVARQ